MLNWELFIFNEFGVCMIFWNEMCIVNFYLMFVVLVKIVFGGIVDVIVWSVTFFSSAGFIDDFWVLVKLCGKIVGEEFV